MSLIQSGYRLFSLLRKNKRDMLWNTFDWLLVDCLDPLHDVTPWRLSGSATDRGSDHIWCWKDYPKEDICVAYVTVYTDTEANSTPQNETTEWNTLEHTMEHTMEHIMEYTMEQTKKHTSKHTIEHNRTYNQRHNRRHNGTHVPSFNLDQFPFLVELYRHDMSCRPYSDVGR